MARALILGDRDTVARKTREGLEAAMDPKELIFKGLIPGMDVVGEKFRRNEYYVPQVLLSARAMYAGLDLLKPLITASAKGDDYLGVVVIGTAQGDLHDIGKNLVAMMLEGAGFKVVNLGRDVAPEKFVEAVTRARRDHRGHLRPHDHHHAGHEADHRRPHQGRAPRAGQGDGRRRARQPGLRRRDRRRRLRQGFHPGRDQGQGPDARGGPTEAVR